MSQQNNTSKSRLEINRNLREIAMDGIRKDDPSGYQENLLYQALERANKEEDEALQRKSDNRKQKGDEYQIYIPVTKRKI